MKLVKASQDITIPDDVKLEVKSRKIRVTGPRGEHDCLHFYIGKLSCTESIFTDSATEAAELCLIRASPLHTVEASLYSNITACLLTGTLTRDFKHLAVDMYKTHDQVENEEGELVEGPLKLRVDCHFGKRKRLAAIRTCTSHVQVRMQADMHCDIGLLREQSSRNSSSSSSIVSSSSSISSSSISKGAPTEFAVNCKSSGSCHESTA